MAEVTPPIRRIPLKIAGVIGFFNAILYLWAILGVEDQSGFPQAWIWLTIMVVAGALGWFADYFPERARAMAIGCTVMFFVLAMFSSTVFALIYLGATVLAGYGWLFIKREQSATAES